MLEEPELLSVTVDGTEDAAVVTSVVGTRVDGSDGAEDDVKYGSDDSDDVVTYGALEVDRVLPKIEKLVLLLLVPIELEASLVMASLSSPLTISEGSVSVVLWSVTVDEAGPLDEEMVVEVISCSVIGVDSNGVMELGSSSEIGVDSCVSSSEADGSTLSSGGIDAYVSSVVTEIREAKVHADESRVIIEGSVESVFTVNTEGGVSSEADNIGICSTYNKYYNCCTI